MTALIRVGRTEMEALSAGPGEQASQSPAELRQSCAEGPDLGTLGAEPLTQSASAAQTPFARFTLSEPMAISVTARNSAADPTLQLLDAQGASLANNDDFDGLDSRIDQSMPLAAGTYCVNVGAIGDSAQPIAVEISRYDQAAALQALYDRGEAAPPMDGKIVPVTDLGSLQNRQRHDVQLGRAAQWFSVRIDEPGLIVAEAISAGGEGDPWLVLYDDLGRQIALNDDNGQSTDAQLTVRVQTGIYLIGVKQLQDRNGFVRLLLERFIAAP